MYSDLSSVFTTFRKKNPLSGSFLRFLTAFCAKQHKHMLSFCFAVTYLLTPYIPLQAVGSLFCCRAFFARHYKNGHPTLLSHYKHAFTEEEICCPAQNPRLLNFSYCTFFSAAICETTVLHRVFRRNAITHRIHSLRYFQVRAVNTQLVDRLKFHVLNSHSFGFYRSRLLFGFA